MPDVDGITLLGELRAEGRNFGRHRLRGAFLEQHIGDEARHLPHVLGTHAPAHDFRRAKAQSVQVAFHLRNRQPDAATQHIGLAQQFRRCLAAAEIPGFDGELMRIGHAAIRRVHGHAEIGKGLRQRLRRLAHHPGIVLAMGFPVEQCHRQCSRFRRIEIGGQAGISNGIQALGDRCIIGEDQSRWRSAKALVGAHGHHMRPLLQRLP